MNAFRRLLPAFGLAVLAGCSSGSPTPSHADISGTWAGPLQGTGDGYFLNTTLTLTVIQADSAITGDYGSAGGMLQFGGLSLQFVYSGAYTGTIAAGNNPAVNIIETALGCPSASAHWSGTYNSADNTLTISGPADVLIPGSCTVQATIQATVILSKQGT